MSLGGPVTFRTAHGAGSSSVAITTPAAGDLIVVCAGKRASATIPSLATGYTSIGTATSQASSQATCRAGAKISDGTETDSGTWTNAGYVTVHIYRGTGATVATAIGDSIFNQGKSASMLFGALTLTVADGTSWVAGFGIWSGTGIDQTYTLSVLDTNRSNDGATGRRIGLDTNNGVSSYAQESHSVSPNNDDWVTGTLEIVAAPSPLFLNQGNLSGCGIGGPFFNNPLN